MSLKNKYLSNLKKENVLVDFYTDNYKCSDFGFVIDFNEEFLFIEKFNDAYIYDGFTVFFQENVTRIRWSGNEIESMSKMIDVSQRSQTKPAIDLKSIHSILKSAKDKFSVLTIHIEDIDSSVCFVGEIHEMDENTIVLHEYGTMTSLDRKFILLYIADITRIDIDGSYEQKLKNLFNV